MRAAVTARTAAGSLSVAREDGSFDLVLCTLVTEYVEDLDRRITEFARVLAQDGRLVLSCDHPFLSGVEKNERGERVLADYFARSPRMYRWFGHEVRVFSHTLEEYMGAMIEAALRIETLREPTPIDQARAKNPDLFERASMIPTIMIISCRKET